MLIPTVAITGGDGGGGGEREKSLEKFSKVSALVYLLYEATISGNFKNLCLLSSRRRASDRRRAFAEEALRARGVGSGSSGWGTARCWICCNRDTKFSTCLGFRI
jgi:hypothetical protein